MVHFIIDIIFCKKKYSEEYNVWEVRVSRVI